MKLTSLLVCAFLALALGTADARPRPHGIQGKKFEANKTFGAGLEFGDPFGLIGKYFLNESHALDFGVGSSVYDDVYGYRGYHLYLDYLWHPLSLASAEAFELPLYIGVGGLVWGWDDRRFGANGVSGTALGFRVPIGVSFDLNNLPLDIFIQTVPTLDLFVDRPAGYGRSLYLFFEFSVGVRFWFS
ncbi:MAG: hypothetical protein JWO36_6630 [Myxococcales bacterium]|nr:hypothetical protein [Myxococcales bacterium]